MKNLLRKVITPYLGYRLKQSDDPLNQLLAAALELKNAKLHEEEFRNQLAEFYKSITLSEFMEYLQFSKLKSELLKPNSYKITLNSTQSDLLKPRWKSLLSPMQKRFALMAYYGVKCDIIILHKDDEVAPHCHQRVVSGFYCLEGSAAIRHYQRISYTDTHVKLKKTIDKLLHPGDYTTNSEYCDDVHWLKAISENCILFRIHVLNTPNTRFRNIQGMRERIYVNPLAEPDENGIITARLIDEAQANQLRF